MIGMKASYPIPLSIAAAETRFVVDETSALSGLSTNDFISRWSIIAYLHPGLHPDDHEHADSGWAKDLKPYAAEAWRRYDIGELRDDQLYCSYASWAGLYDSMISHTKEEKALRERIASGKF